MDQVHEQLYIGAIVDARTEPLSEFDAVVTVCQDDVVDHIPEGVDYHYFDMCDGPQGQSRGRCDYDIFKYAARTILIHLEAGDTVFVHCHMGQSRSSSTSIAALGVYEQEDYFTIHDRVEEARPQIMPMSTLVDHAKRFIEEHTDIRHKPSMEGVDGVY